MVYTDRIHIIADSERELHAFAKKIGLNFCWFDPAPPIHYDFPFSHSGGRTREQLIQAAIDAGAKVYANKFEMMRARNKNSIWE